MADGAWQAGRMEENAVSSIVFTLKDLKRDKTQWFCKTVVCSVPTEVWVQVPAGGEEVVMAYRGGGGL
jgi:hypothetical protein